MAFYQQSKSEIGKEELALLIASSLRRSSTLYGWLIEADEYPEIIKRELFAAVDAQDRDKSDAAKSIIDVGSIYLSERDMSELVGKLAKSGYAHFKEEARSWGNKERQNRKLSRRIENAKLVPGGPLKEKKLPDLRAIADGLAKDFLVQKSNTLARKLADVNVVIWSKRTKRVKLNQSKKPKGRHDKS